MNEPGTSFDLYSHVTDLSEETKEVGQKYFPKKTRLSKGLTHWDSDTSVNPGFPS